MSTAADGVERAGSSELLGIANGSCRLAVLILALTLLFGIATTAEAAATKASHFVLANGLELVVIEDNRVPVVTHQLWIKAGSVDESEDNAGIAHFLEHLMFKGTTTLKPGEFDRLIISSGGVNNAFTTYDSTYYFERLPKAKLSLLMQLGADRLVNLVIPEAEVAPERGAVIEERRMRVDNQPNGVLGEQLRAALFPGHAYGRPILGKREAVLALDRRKSVEFYQRYYAPNNAIVVVAGDVEPAAVKLIAEATYGKLPRRLLAEREPVLPAALAAPVRVEFTSPLASRASVVRAFRVPSHVTASGHESEALQLLQSILGGGTTSRIYQDLVLNSKSATAASAIYTSDRDGASFELYADVADGVSVETVEKDLDRLIRDVVEFGIGELELEENRSMFKATEVYDADNQVTLATTYGSNLADGVSIGRIEGWTTAIGAVSLADINAVARHYLADPNSVTVVMRPGGGASASVP